MNEFKLIVAGGRDFNDYTLLHSEIIELADGIYKDRAVSIVSGMARGADALAVRFARELGVTLYEFPADWMRNEAMADFADGLLAFWDGQSRGTAHMIQTMERMGKPVYIRHY